MKLLISLLFILCSAVLHAQIIKYSVNGGSRDQTSPNYRLRSSVGQVAIGISGNNTQVRNGFWYANVSCEAPNPLFDLAYNCQEISLIDLSVDISEGASYLWDFGDGITSNQIGDVTHEYVLEGDYLVRLTITQNGCSETFEQQVRISEEIDLSLSITQEISAPGAADGAIDLMVNGGTAPFTFEWSNGADTEDLMNLPAGTYQVTVTDANGCTTSAEITLEAPIVTNNCFASEVVSFSQGLKKNRKPIDAQRSDPALALDKPQENNTFNFVSLGFGGSITLKLGEDLYDDGTYRPDFILVETTFGRADEMCFSNGTRSYPEMAFVEVSQDGSIWYSLPNAQCRTSFIDISPAIEQGIGYVRYVRITDASNKSWFGRNADGYDVDGIITCRAEVETAFDRLTNARVANNTTTTLFDPTFFNRLPDEENGLELTVFPNPVKDNDITINFFNSIEEAANLEIISASGKVVLDQNINTIFGDNSLLFNAKSLPRGYYIVKLTTASGNTSHQRFIKQ